MSVGVFVKLAALAAVAAQVGLGEKVIRSETEFTVKLLSPIDTRTSKAGDPVTAQVQTPEPFKGDIMEGQVKESKRGKKLKGTAVLLFSFETLHHAGNPVKLQSSVKSVANSKGVSGVDEEGRVIKKKNNLGKTAAAAGVGALIGAVAGGARGAAIGAGIGAAAGLVFIQVGAEGADVSFAPGSEFILEVKQR